MKRIGLIVASVLVGAALIGVGAYVGARVEQTDSASANAEGPITSKDALILPTFSEAATEFEKQLELAKSGKNVGDKLMKQAVVVRHISGTAEGSSFKEVSTLTAEAMMLLSAGVIADDGATVQAGFEKYQQAQEKIYALVDEVKNSDALNEPTTAPE
ncbi:MAG: hypothetical protein KDC39_13785 [Actinobacteria bacterium]|nr:hypothetical protein [Actinomycetota bacterium]